MNLLDVQHPYTIEMYVEKTKRWAPFARYREEDKATAYLEHLRKQPNHSPVRLTQTFVCITNDAEFAQAHDECCADCKRDCETLPVGNYDYSQCLEDCCDGC